MGTVDRHVACSTCNSDYIECPGHFGHLELKKPVYHLHMMRTVHRILQCVCWNCSKLLIDSVSECIMILLFQRDGSLKAIAGNTRLRRGPARLREIAAISRGKRFCPGVQYDEDINDESGNVLPRHGGCDAEQPIYKMGRLQITKEDRRGSGEGNDRKQVMDTEEILKIFKKISDEDCRQMGLNPKEARPEWLLITVLPIPPMTVRPSVLFDSSARSEDDLTHKIVDIIKANRELEQQLFDGAAPVAIQNHFELLQTHVATYFDNSTPSIEKAKRRGYEYNDDQYHV